MLVLCSLLVSNFYEHELLRAVLVVGNRKPGLEKFTLIFKNPIYLPVRVDYTTSITIQLVGDDLKLIPECELATVAVLHFKKRWIP